MANLRSTTRIEALLARSIWASCAGVLLLGLMLLVPTLLAPHDREGTPSVTPSPWLYALFVVGTIAIFAILATRISNLARREDARRGQVEGELRANAICLYEMLDAMEEAVVTINSEGLIQSTNRATSRLFGYPPEALYGQNLSMLMPEPHRSSHDDYLRAYLATGRPKIIGIGRDVEGKHADGSLFPLHLNVHAIPFHREQRFVGILRDIQDETKVRREIEQLRDFVKHTLDSLTANICVLDQEGTIIQVNASWRRFGEQNGLRCNNAGVGSNYFATCENRFDTQNGYLIGQALRQILDGSEDSFIAEYPCHSPEQQRWMILRATSFVSEAGRYLVIAHEDITALRNTKQELADKVQVLHTTLETMGQGILMVDHELKVLASNKKYFQLMQLPPEWSDQPLTLYDLVRYSAQRGDFGPGEVEQQVRMRTAVFDQRAPRLAHFTFSNGSVVEIVWNTLPSGKGAVGTFNDITQRQRTEKELRRAKELADAANEAKSAFLATMSHEIRTPMYGIIGLAELLEGTPLVADQKKMVKALRDSGNSLLAIINDILDLSRIEAGKLHIDVEPMSLRTTVQSVVDILRPAAEKKHLDFSVSIATDVPDRLLGDAGRVRQILFNLAGNAVKFTDSVGSDLRPGHVQLSVQTESTDGVSPCIIRFVVEDNGIGMSEQTVSRLFQPFSQADSATTRRYGGSGLGLSICARLVAMMDGVINITSSLDRGSTFTVRLPLPDAQENETTIAFPAPPVEAAATVPATGDVRLLVAEDNELNQEIIRRQLSQLGYVADVVSNGHEALESLARGDYALLLTDCYMPEMDGYALAQAVREREVGQDGLVKRLPIIAFTANILMHDLQRCHEVGMDDVIGKPVMLEELARTLARWVTQERVGPKATTGAVPVSPYAETLTEPDSRSVKIERLIDLIGPKPGPLIRVLNKFIDAEGMFLAEIDALIETADAAGFGALGHKFKSSARTVGADALADACADLEAKGKAGDLSGCSIQAMIVTAFFASAVGEIRAYLATLG